MNHDIAALLRRSNRLGSDKRITNFAGGNTSAKLVLPDPITHEPVRVLAVKGSGGDLGTLTEKGLALLRLDRVLALEALHAAGVHEDDIVELYADCMFGTGGAVPSIDTPLHAFVEAAHVDHMHPDSLIALAAAADGEALVRECFGDEIGWLPWQRPGFELGLALRDFCSANPAATGVVMGGHGVISWADSSEACEQHSLALVSRAEAFLAQRGRDHAASASHLDAEVRRRVAVDLAPRLRGAASHDRLMVGHFTDSPVVLDFLARPDVERLVALGTSCPDHFLRTKVKPMLLAGFSPDDPAAFGDAELQAVHAEYRAQYHAYYAAHAVDGSPAIRGADPAIVLVPGVGMWSYGTDPQTARVAGEFYVNAINVIRGAESLSTYSPISDAEKFRIEYWELEERKLRMKPPAPVLQGRIALVTGGASGIGRAIANELAARGACVVVADRDSDGAEKVAADLGHERALAVAMDVSNEAEVEAGFRAACERFGSVDLVVNNAGFAAAAPLVDTTVDEWDRLHAVLARGSFLVSRAAARVMTQQGRIGRGASTAPDDGAAGDIVYIVSKNGVVAGPQNIAYGAAKADQAHQVRLLAAELGPVGIRVNAINPDGVVQGSGIFSGDWLDQRAEAYGVAPDQLGKYYAGRTLLGREVLPQHVADAVMALVDGRLSRTTGLTIPVDGGLSAAFLR